MGYSSPAQAGITEDLGLSLAAYSIFGSILTIGGMIGALFCGSIAAIHGRKYTMWLSQAFCTTGWVAIILANRDWWLYVGRFSIGCGVGMITYVVPIYVAEITAKENRGRFASANQLLADCGFSLTYFMGNIVSWRTLAIFGLAPGILQLIGLLFVPESPRWLAQVGREKEFEASLQLMRGKDVDIYKEKQEIKKIVEAYKEDTSAKVMDLFQRKYTYSLFVGVGLILCLQFSGLPGVAFYASTIVERAGFETSTGTIIISMIQVPTAVAALFLMDYYGRRPLLMVSCCGVCLSGILIGVSFTLQGFGVLNNFTPIFIVIGVTLYIGTFSLGLAGIPWLIMSEIFPMNVKAIAGSLITFVSWSASWIITYTFNFMLQWSSAGTFFIFAGICGASVAFTWKFVPETKGRTLEEIQSSMTTYLL